MTVDMSDEERRAFLSAGTRTAKLAVTMGAERAEEFGRRNAVPGEMLVRVVPTRIVAKARISD